MINTLNIRYVSTGRSMVSRFANAHACCSVQFLSAGRHTGPGE